jgi:putative ABC transport system substrate-binding protein
MVKIVQQQTQTIPIVIFIRGDVLVRGLVKNLAHPEGNTTGVTNLFQSLAGKWVELLKEAVPRLHHVGVFYNTQVQFDPQLEGYFTEVEEASRVLGVRAERIPFGMRRTSRTALMPLRLSRTADWLCKMSAPIGQRSTL